MGTMVNGFALAALLALAPVRGGAETECRRSMASKGGASVTALAAESASSPVWTAEDLRDLARALERGTVRDIDTRELEFLAERLVKCLPKHRGCAGQALERVTGRRLPPAAHVAIQRWLTERVTRAARDARLVPGATICGLTAAGDPEDLTISEARTAGALGREGLVAVALGDQHVRRVAALAPNEAVADLLFATATGTLVITEVKLALEMASVTTFEKALGQLASTARALVRLGVDPALIVRLEVSLFSPASVTASGQTTYRVGRDLALLRDGAPVLVEIAPGQSVPVHARFFQP